MGELSIDTPITRFVGIRQGGSANRLAKTHMVALGSLSRPTNFNVLQTLAMR